MVLDATPAQLNELCGQLCAYNGHRTLWLDTADNLLHAEPEDELETLGHRYVGTFFRPTANLLGETLARFVRVKPIIVTAPPRVVSLGAAVPQPC